MGYLEQFINEFLGESGFIFYLLYYFLTFGLSVAAYVLSSYSMYTIANKRGIKKGWLAWLPYGSSWIIGSISDQYQYVVKGKKKSKRKSLLIMDIVSSVLAVVVLVSVVVFVVQVAIFYDGMETEELLTQVLTMLGQLALGYLLLLVIAIVWTVIRYMALYDLYRSCDPGNAEAFLILSIFLSVTEPVLLFIDRKKERGMPPRKADVAQQAAIEPVLQEAPAEEGEQE